MLDHCGILAYSFCRMSILPSSPYPFTKQIVPVG
jgi:hypothetical protein